MRQPGAPYTQEEIRSLHLKGAVYIRMSTEMQTESPENQERQIRAYAAQYGIEIVKVYADLGVSGMTAENSWSCFMRQVCGKNKMERFVVYAAFLSSPFRGSGPLWRWMPLYTSSGV